MIGNAVGYRPQKDEIPPEADSFDIDDSSSLDIVLEIR
jgi:hypothetical protein